MFIVLTCPLTPFQEANNRQIRRVFFMKTVY
jgi:hypothetical protein